MNNKQLIGLIELIDLPGHDDVVSMARSASAAAIVIEAISAALVWAGLLYFIPGLPKLAIIGVSVGIAAISILLNYANVNAQLSFDRFSKWFISIGVVAGVVAGFAYSSSVKGGWLTFAIAAFIGGLGGLFCGMFATLFGWIFSLILGIVLKAGMPVQAVLGGAFATSLNRKLQTKHKAWLDSNGKPIVTFSRYGVQRVNTSAVAGPVFVASADLRRNGLAHEERIPKFTQTEIFNPAHVTQTMRQALSDLDSPLINPATGLPMIDGGMGGVDVGGNAWGLHGVNPANGLPTVGGAASFDIAGNPWGSNN